MDLKGFSLGNHFTKDTRELVKSFIKMASDNYPETVFKIFVVNAPFVFRSAYALASPFIHPVTRDKIRICGGPSPSIVHENSLPIWRSRSVNFR